MKKNSKNLLKNTIRKIRNNQYRLPQLYEKLEYYEVKMIGYNSPSFEPRYSSSSPSHLSNLDYWLEKVWVVENQIKEINKQYLRFSKFMNLLDKEIRLIIHDRYFENIQVKEILTKYKIDRNKYYWFLKKANNRLNNFLKCNEGC